MTVDLDSYRAQAREWLAANLELRRPEASLRANDIGPDEVVAGRALQKKVYEAGYLGIAIPVDYGGRGLSDDHQRVWNEESSGYDLPAPGGIATGVTVGIIVPTLLTHATEQQKREWIPKMLSGDEIWVQLLSEPGAGSDLAGLLTRAARDGDGWVLNGSKVWSSGAVVADFGVCLARTDWDAPKHRGLTWFKVPLRDAQVTVRPVREINGSSEFCEEFLDDVVVGDDMVIGGVNEGWAIANTMLAVERRGGARAHGGGGVVGARRLAPDLVALAEARGLDDDPATRQQIARAHINDYMQVQLTSRVMEMLAGGKADGSVASLIKLGQGIVQPLRAQIALDLAGRSGIAWEPGDETGGAPAINYLNGRIMAIAGGSNQIQRNIISERLLGLPREVSADGDKPFSEVLRDARELGRQAAMKLGVNVGMRGDPDVFKSEVRRLEEVGVDYLWSGEAYMADAVSALGFLAAITERAQIGSSILPIYSRTPTLIAMTAVGLDKLSGGRFVLGIGASGPQVIEGFHGVPYDRPLGRTREIIDVCRQVWRRERLEHDGESYHIPLPDGQGTGLGKVMKIMDKPLRDRIPIHVAALGPKNVAMTAELCEGWLPLHFWPDRADRIWSAAVAEGLAKRPSEMPPLDIVAGGPLAIGDDVAHLRDRARPMLALYFGGMGAKGANFYNDVLRGYGFEQVADEIQDAYLGGDKKAAEAMVPQELIDGISLVGDEGFVRDRVAAYKAAGVTVLNVQPVGPNGITDIETLAGWL